MAWLVLLFVGFGIMMLIGIVCSIWMHHVAVMYYEAHKLAITIYVSSFMICIIIILYNAIRDYPIPAFFILGFGILIVLLFIASVLYVPLVYQIVFNLIRGDKARNQIDTSFRVDGGEDQLDQL